ncbi:MAG: hypothetical protein JO276_12270 [Sphingomonadaceae bacterium]|nr:hypothetical protein [Sphingomonadaceae bacterium]
MTPKRPLGVLRLLRPILGRARGRRRGPSASLIWRRPRRAGPAPAASPAARTTIFAPSYSLNLELVWPAGTEARTGPIGRQEARTHLVTRSGPGGGARETHRLTTLVERVWLHLSRATPSSARDAAPARPAASPASSPAAGTQSRQRAPTLSPTPLLWARPKAGAVALLPGRAALRAGAPGLPPRQSMTAPATAHADAGVESPPATRAPAETLWRSVTAEPGIARARGAPRRAPAALVWRSETGKGDAAAPMPAFAGGHGRPRTDLVWRRPAPNPAIEAGDGRAAASPRDSATDQPWRGETRIRADRAPLAAAPAPAVPPVEMNRLVDEVVRRLDRIARDERLRRGL